MIESKVSAQDAHRDVTQIAYENSERHHQTGEELRLPGGCLQIFVDLIEFSRRLFFSPECFDDRVAGVHLFDVTVYFTKISLLVMKIAL